MNGPHQLVFLSFLSGRLLCQAGEGIRKSSTNLDIKLMFWDQGAGASQAVSLAKGYNMNGQWVSSGIGDGTETQHLPLPGSINTCISIQPLHPPLVISVISSGRRMRWMSLVCWLLRVRDRGSYVWELIIGNAIMLSARTQGMAVNVDLLCASNPCLQLLLIYSWWNVASGGRILLSSFISLKTSNSSDQRNPFGLQPLTIKMILFLNKSRKTLKFLSPYSEMGQIENVTQLAHFLVVHHNFSASKRLFHVFNFLNSFRFATCIKVFLNKWWSSTPVSWYCIESNKLIHKCTYIWQKKGHLNI